MLETGDRETAQRLADEEVALARAFGAPRALGVANRAAGVVAGGERGEELLREAIDDARAGDAGSSARGRSTDLGALLRRGNRRTEARELLREALDAAHRAGAEPLARASGDRAARDRRASAAPRPDRARALTASERRVAELASRGPHEPRDRAGALRHRAHSRGPPDERLPQAAARLARASFPARCARTPRSRRRAEKSGGCQGGGTGVPGSAASTDRRNRAEGGPDERDSESSANCRARPTGVRNGSRPDDAGYDAARAVHNGLVDRKPALIVRCRTHVRRRRGARVRAPGRARGLGPRRRPQRRRPRVTDGGVMIDLAEMKGISIDPERATARRRAASLGRS